MEQLPTYVNLLFGFTVLATIGWFHFATKSRTYLLLIISWIIIQTLVGLSGIYQNAKTIPPRIFLFGVLPTLVVIFILFLTKNGKTFINNIDLKTLTYFHTIRIPVEIVLLLLFQYGAVSRYMTFEGTNFDLFSGLTAAVIAYIAFRKGAINKKLLIGWNIICLLLLFNVVITAILALPSPFQRLSLEQPNIAVLYFPFNLLPTVIVPTVLLGHLAALWQLLRSK